jgi:hypothetical protein
VALAAACIAALAPASWAAPKGNVEQARSGGPKAAKTGKNEVPASAGKGKAQVRDRTREPKAPAHAGPSPRGKAHGLVRRAGAPASPAAPAAPPETRPSHRRTAREDARPVAERGKVTLCHATGSRTNPYVLITVSVNATSGNGHGRHDNDLIPVSSGSCPRASGPEGGGEPGGPAPGPGEQPGGDEADDAPVAADEPYSGDQPRLAAGRSGAVPAPAGDLPFTGLPLLLLFLVGAGALGAGVVLRRRPDRSSAVPPASR